MGLIRMGIAAAIIKTMGDKHNDHQQQQQQQQHQQQQYQQYQYTQPTYGYPAAQPSTHCHHAESRCMTRRQCRRERKALRREMKYAAVADMIHGRPQSQPPAPAPQGYGASAPAMYQQQPQPQSQPQPQYRSAVSSQPGQQRELRREASFEEPFGPPPQYVEGEYAQATRESASVKRS